jgi:hypothetical protein
MSSQRYALGALGCLVAYYVISKLVAYIEAVRFSRAHGCKPVPKLAQSETIVGWGLAQELNKNRANKTLLESGRKRFIENGDTFQLTVMGQTFLTTNDPENIKTLLATNFKDFGIGHRLKSMGALFGSGIFTTDGAQWEHSRVICHVSCDEICADHSRLSFDQTLQGLKLPTSIPSNPTFNI